MSNGHVATDIVKFLHELFVGCLVNYGQTTGLIAHIIALEVIFYNEMRYINLRFTYLRTYLLI